MSVAAVEREQPGSALNRVWEPLEIGTTRVKNRIMMTAQTTLYGKDNILGDRHVDYYRERAKGGAALFICEQQAAHRLSKGSFFEGCSAWEKRAIPQYAKLADAVHEHGARQFIQLFGCGVHDKGTMIMDEWHPLWGVSKLPSVVHGEIPLSWSRRTSTTWCAASPNRRSTCRSRAATGWRFMPRTAICSANS